MPPITSQASAQALDILWKLWRVIQNKRRGKLSHNILYFHGNAPWTAAITKLFFQIFSGRSFTQPSAFGLSPFLWTAWIFCWATILFFCGSFDFCQFREPYLLNIPSNKFFFLLWFYPEREPEPKKVRISGKSFEKWGKLIACQKRNHKSIPGGGGFWGMENRGTYFFEKEKAFNRNRRRRANNIKL